MLSELASIARWRKTCDCDASDDVRWQLAVVISGSRRRAAHVRLWEESPQAPGRVFLEVLYHGIAPEEDAELETNFRASLEFCLQEQRSAEFRLKLKKYRVDKELRRRGIAGNSVGSCQLESGDSADETWRESLRKQPSDPQIQLHGADKTQGGHFEAFKFQI